MRVFVGVCLALILGLVPRPAVAQEAEVLRRELEQLKQQFQIMQQQYQKTIQDMSDRLQRLETQPSAPSPAAGAPTAPAPVATGAPTTTPRTSSQISALELARPRKPFALYERRGAGQLLFDMGWYSATYLRRAGRGVGAPFSNSDEPALTDKGGT